MSESHIDIRLNVDGPGAADRIAKALAEAIREQRRYPHVCPPHDLSDAWAEAEAAGISRDAIIRFISCVNVNGEKGCWLWTGSVTGGTRGGYGHLSIDGKDEAAHRFSYRLMVGPLADGEWVLHTCDVKACVNPVHLYAGSHADNTRDAIDRERMATGDRNGQRLYPERRPRGESQGSARLTGEDIIAIRRLSAAGKSLKAIAAEFGVDPTTIGRIVRRTAWAHIE